MASSVSTPAPAASLNPSRNASAPARKVVLVSVLGAAALATLFFFPRYWLWCFAGVPLRDVVSIQPEFNRAFFALQQLHDPWQRIENPTHRVIEWRLLFPLLGHYLALPDRVYLALPFVGCLGALGVAATGVWRATSNARATAAISLLVATSSWYFVSTGWLAYFDSWLIAALLLATFAETRWVLLGSACVAPWIDERYILALPVCFAARAVLAEGASLRDAWRHARWIVGGVAPYLVIRLLAELTHSRATGGAYWSDRTAFTAPLAPTLLGVWHGLRLGWVVVAVGLYWAARRGQWLALLCFLAGLLVNLAVADDVSRSASMAVPLLVAGAILWLRRSSRAPSALGALAVGNLLLPAAHIIATPLSTVEHYHRAPIMYLYSEREHAANPPSYADPAVYTTRGVEALQAGEFEIARGQFELALRYNPEFAKARAQRGILWFATGQKEAGLAEINHALALDPQLFDVRLQRATFRQQLGDATGALEDAREALRTMPERWPKRREAEAFERQLAARVGR